MQDLPVLEARYFLFCQRTFKPRFLHFPKPQHLLPHYPKPTHPLTKFSTMTREVRKLGAKVTIVEPPALRRVIRDPPDVVLEAPKPNRYIYTEAISPSVQRLNRDLLAPKEAPKPPKKQKVSIAGVFKKPQKVKTGRISKKKQNHREGTPELDLIGDLQGTVFCVPAPDPTC